MPPFAKHHEYRWRSAFLKFFRKVGKFAASTERLKAKSVSALKGFIRNSLTRNSVLDHAEGIACAYPDNVILESGFVVQFRNALCYKLLNNSLIFFWYRLFNSKTLQLKHELQVL